MTDNDTSTDGTDGETVYVEEAPRRIFGNLLIDGCDGQCAYIYAGIEERCPNDAVAHTFLSNGKKVEMCAEHAREDVPEPPKTEQKELVTDGGTVEDDAERFRVEAEVIGEDYARILRNIIEGTEGCRLTAFDREM